MSIGTKGVLAGMVQGVFVCLRFVGNRGFMLPLKAGVSDEAAAVGIEILEIYKQDFGGCIIFKAFRIFETKERRMNGTV